MAQGQNDGQSFANYKRELRMMLIIHDGVSSSDLIC